jgi:hypothetical protein
LKEFCNKTSAILLARPKKSELIEWKLKINDATKFLDETLQNHRKFFKYTKEEMRNNGYGWVYRICGTLTFILR